MSLLNVLKRQDRAENSIMQTISIAVSAILIASGLVTAPGLINNARDNLARTDLANLAYAQEFALANAGQYYRYLTSGQELEKTGENKGDNLYDAVISNGNGLGNRLAGSSLSADDNGNNTGFKFSFSGSVLGHEARVCQAPSFFIMKDHSSSGKWFYRGSANGTTSSNLGDITIPAAVLAACPNIIDNFEGGSPTTPTNPVIPIPAGAAKLDVDVNSMVNDAYAAISGYNKNDTSHLGFGGGNSWTPEAGTQIIISYFDPVSASLVQFTSHTADGSNNALVEYDDYSGMLFGNLETYEIDSDEVNFTKIKTNGGSMKFTSAETGASVTAVWYPSTGDWYEPSPNFPQAAIFRDKWERVDNIGDYYYRAETVAPDGLGILSSYVAVTPFSDGNGDMRYSADGGNTSYIVNSPQNPNGMGILANPQTSNNGSVWWVQRASTYYRSADQGNTWDAIDVSAAGTDVSNGAASFSVNSDGSKISFVGGDGSLTVFDVTSGGFTTFVFNDGSQPYLMKWSPDGKLYITTTYGGSYYSSDFGDTFEAIPGLEGIDIMSIDTSADGSTVVVGSGTNYDAPGGLYISHDYGMTWTRNAALLSEDGRYKNTTAKVSADGQSILASIYRDYYGGNAQLWVTRDGGVSWVKQDSAGNTSTGGWTVYVSTDFSKIYAFNRNTNYLTGMWRHVDGDTECYENCPSTDDGGGGGGDE